MFLSKADLEQLTGAKRPSLQLQWLRTSGLRHHVRRDGKPVVLLADVTGTATTEPPRVRPNRAAVKR